MLHLAGGNPGANNVLNKIAQWTESGGDESLSAALTLLDQHAVIGPILWIAYKDYAKYNVDTMLSAISARSPELLAVIQRAHPDWNYVI